MAVATVTLTNTTLGVGARIPGGTLQTFNMAISASPDTYAAGGLSIPWRSAAKGTTKPPLPGTVKIDGLAGYQMVYDDAGQKVKIRQQRDPAAAGGADIPFTELAAAAIPAALSGDTIKVSAIFPFGG